MKQLGGFQGWGCDSGGRLQSGHGALHMTERHKTTRAQPELLSRPCPYTVIGGRGPGGNGEGVCGPPLYSAVSCDYNYFKMIGLVKPGGAGCNPRCLRDIAGVSFSLVPWPFFSPP